MRTPTLSIQPDGVFHLSAGPLQLASAYPMIDHRAVAPLSVETSENRIVYHLAKGSLTLDFRQLDEVITISARLDGFTEAPHWVHPLGNAEVTGADRLFRTGVGFSGPTNFVPLQSLKGGEVYESYLVTGICSGDGTTLAIGALEHRNFQQQCRLRTQPRFQNFRNRELAAMDTRFEAGFSTERIPLPEKRLELPPLCLRTGRTPWEVLRTQATAVGEHMQARLDKPSEYHWCSWYDRGRYLSLDELIEFLDGAKAVDEPLQYVQIDDGYMPHLGDWLENIEHLWPGGMERTAKEIQARGYTPGIWVGPYMVDCRSRIYREHPDWVLHDLEGKPLAAWKTYNSSRDSKETYVLDTSHPEAFAYLRNVFRTLRKWGYQMFKTDFVEWGWKDSTTVRRHTPGKTSAQYHDDVARMIREEIGEESSWLVCIGYFAPYIGYADAIRVSSDTGVDWSGPGGTGNDGVGGGVANVVSETYNCQYFNNVLYQTDPDVVYLRDYHNNLSDAEVRSLALFFGILGVSINTSDQFHRMPEDRLALWRFIEPAPERHTATLPFWGRETRLHTAVRAYEAQGAWGVLILNPTNERQLERYAIYDLIGHEKAFAYTWGPEGATLVGELTEIITDLSSHDSQLLYLNTEDVPPPETLSLGGATYRK